MDRQRLTYLITQYSNNNFTPEEWEELSAWLQQGEHPEWFTELVEGWMKQEADLPIALEPYQGLSEKVLQIDRQLPHVRRIPIYRRSLFRYAAAVLVAVTMAGYLIFHYTHKAPALADRPGKNKPVDIAPGRERATLTLGDGSSINLDSAAGGTLAKQGNTIITKLAGGQVKYAAGAGEGMMNLMRTPRGGRYRLTLPDGTEVWLNAASSIAYPSSFTGSRRIVTVTGEVYLEVAKDKARPFEVRIGPGPGSPAVEVLGTSFNINAYPDEGVIRTTLLEGGVKVTAGGAASLLHPGEQARTGAGAGPGEVQVVRNVDVEQVMAWKNGLFNFEGASLESVLRQLARWYDLEIVYAIRPPLRKFGGEISMDLNLSQVLKLLDKMEVKYELDGKKLILM